MDVRSELFSFFVLFFDGLLLGEGWGGGDLCTICPSLFALPLGVIGRL